MLTVFGNTAAEKICNLMTYSFLIISSYVRILQDRKTERLCNLYAMLSMLPLHLAVVPVSCSF